MSSPGRHISTLTLPFDVIKTLYTGTSEVRLYENEVTGVKQIGKRVSAFGAEKAAVFREPTVLQSLVHDHIVPVYTVANVTEEKQDSLLTVIEMIIPYYPRGSAYDALGRGERFSIGAAVELTRQGLLGLSELHEGQKLLHRDIKSANVFLDERGRLRIGDLGLAIPMEPDGTAEVFQNAQMYTAPEIWVASRVARSTDIFGFGMVLLELMCGPFPYDRYTRDGVYERLKLGRRPLKDADLAFSPQVAPPLRRVVTKAIKRDPTERYQTASEMLDALEHARYIDWAVPVSTDETIVWLGTAKGDSDTKYEVRAQRRKRPEGWRLSARKFVTRWQRFGLDDQDVTAVAGKSTTEFFDEVFKHSTSL